MKTRLFALFLCVFLLKPAHATAQSDDLIEMAEDGVVESSGTASGQGGAPASDSQSVKRQTLADAVKKVTAKMSADVLGESRYESQKAGIASKILPQFEKYIPLIRRGEPTVTADAIKVRFNFRVSPQSMRALLIEEGFLQLSDRPVSLLPLFSISDQTNGTSFAWWLQTPAGIVESDQPHWTTSQKMTARLMEGFTRSGIMVLSPATHHMNRWVPDSLRREKLGNEDLPLIGQIMKAQILLTGSLTFERPDATANTVRATLHYAAIPIKQDRPIAEVSESEDFTIAPGASISDDRLSALLDRATASLVSQVIDVWNRGGINVETVKLVISGDLSPADLDRVRLEITRTGKGVRAIRERAYQRGTTTFEVDLSSGANNFAQGFSRDSIEGFSTKMISSTHDEVDLKISANHPN